ncbi:glycosyltransferase family 2 protein [Candidatus Beckwithbacteria bacterium]|nr:glycosyltransferase family 2 protein [Candidatus Beckwithbacteria bacterium]
MPNNKLSICLLARNEAANIARALESVKNLADEIVVVVDQTTTDNTAQIAKKYTKKVFVKTHQEQFHVNKQIAINLAKNEWVLWLDADEKVSPALAKEIKRVLENPAYDGYEIPRKNLLFGKWMKYSNWYPDYQLRLFKKSQITFPCEHIHEHPEIDGQKAKLNHHLYHYNYQTISQFIDKLNRYTSADATYFAKQIHPPFTSQLIKRPFDEFLRRFFAFHGYKDGIHGLALALLQAFYELVVVLKVWELKKFDTTYEKKTLATVQTQTTTIAKDFYWWIKEVAINKAANPLQKLNLKVKRKIGL